MANDKTKPSDISKNLSGEALSQQDSSGNNPILKPHEEGEINLTSIVESADGGEGKSKTARD